MALLEVNNLSTYYSTREGYNHALDNFSIKVEEGEMLGLIGESGCGKSTAGFSILRMIQFPGKIISGEVNLGNNDIMKLSDEELRNVLWKDVAMIPQSAMNALNPSYKVGDQIAEAILLHSPGMKKSDAKHKVYNLLKSVGMDERWYNAYPHKLSGGMKQRAIIAMALACDPKLIISDESTTGLDVLIQAQILALLKKLQHERGLALIVITHDLHMVTAICEKIGVMYAGNLVETGTSEEILKDAKHPYTKALFSSQINIDNFDKTVESIDGVVLKLVNPEEKCRFYDRCTEKNNKCTGAACKMLKISDTHYVACHLEG